jgi:7-cyano-7-deazaguanine synthase
MRRSVCLISGGLDSTVAATWAKKQGWQLYGLTVNYGQRHQKEIQAAQQVAATLDFAAWKLFALDLTVWGGSALTQESLAVPRGRPPEAMAQDIPVTYVPLRNTLFLSLAAAWAEVLEAECLVIGANALDYSGYPDCRPEFYRALEEAFRLGSKRGVEGKPVKIEAPLITLSKKEIVLKGIELKAPLHLTWSCYLGEEKPCGTCDSCLLRAKGFREAGMKDPIL